MQNGPQDRWQGLTAASLRITEHFKKIIILCFIAEVILSSFNIITTFDFPWQLAEGEFILDHGYPTKSVLQAYGEISPNFSNEYILYEIVIASVNHFAGWLGLCLFFGIVGVLIYVPCLMVLMRSKGQFSAVEIFLFLIAQAIINWRMNSRPELIADVCFVFVGVNLLQFEKHGWNRWQTVRFALIFCVWANAHGTFLIGLAMMGLWYGQMLLFRWREIFGARDVAWVKPGVFALAGCMMNPFGVYRFVQPFALHGLLWGQGTSLEMWPNTMLPTPPGWAAVFGLLMAGLIGGIMALGRQRQKAYWLLVLLLTLQWLVFTSNRYSIFFGLTLLLIIWGSLEDPPVPSSPRIFSLPFAFGKNCFYLIWFLLVGYYTACLAEAKAINIKSEGRFLYPNTLMSVNSSFAWLRMQPSSNYVLLSHLGIGSYAQMPGYNGIHPLLDSGTPRYSDRVNELNYYIMFDPEAFDAVASRLKVNVIIIDHYTFPWAVVLNASPEWTLTAIDSGSQLYIRKNCDVSVEKKMFRAWEQTEDANSSGSDFDMTNNILRGLNLRPDDESLRLLESTPSIAWAFDPQINYLRDWLREVSDDLVQRAAKNIGGQTGNSSRAVRILFALRLKQYNQAAEIAKDWKLSFWDRGYQPCRELQAEAFISAGDNETARKILASLWPQPRYSLRWAKLCQAAYADRKDSEPINARALVDLDERQAWRNDLIGLLNQNISHLSGL